MRPPPLASRPVGQVVLRHIGGGGSHSPGRARGDAVVERVPANRYGSGRNSVSCSRLVKELRTRHM